MRQYPVQACYSDVTNQLCSLAHNLCGNLCLGCDGQISGACGNYRQDGFGLLNLFLLEDDCLGRFFVAGLREFFCFSEGLEDGLFGPGGQDVITFFGQCREDFDYLLCGLAGAVDGLGEAAANLAVVVYVGKTQVLEREMPEFANRLVNADVVVFDLL